MITSLSLLLSDKGFGCKQAMQSSNMPLARGLDALFHIISDHSATATSSSSSRTYGRTCTHNAHARRNAHARAHTEITNKRKQQRDWTDDKRIARWEMGRRWFLNRRGRNSIKNFHFKVNAFKDFSTINSMRRYTRINLSQFSNILWKIFHEKISSLDE